MNNEFKFLEKYKSRIRR